jgi:hypothetical protein
MEITLHEWRKDLKDYNDLYLIETIATVTKELLRRNYNAERKPAEERKEVRRSNEMKIRTHL